MKKLSKKYAAALALVEKGKVYSVSEAAELVKKTSITKFDASVDIAFKLNLNTKQADQQLRGTVTLPFGNGKTKKILAVTNTKVEEAKAAGSDFVGGKEMLQKIQSENWFDFDVIVATPDMMGELGKMGRILGPKGLMPNPKAGTVSMDIASAIKEIKNGKLEYRTDKEGNISLPIAKVSFDAEKIVKNIETVVALILKIKPQSVKGTYVQNCVISSTMGPSIKIAVESK